MSSDLITNMLALHIVAAFVVFILYHFQLVLRILGDSPNGLGIGQSSNSMALLMAFFAGDIYPNLRRKWIRSAKWLACSILLLFGYVALLSLT